MRFFLGLLRGLAAILIAVTAVPAVLALAGFAIPLLDLFNHVQVLLFFGTLVGLLFAVAVGLGRRWQIVGLVGLLASSVTFAPEWASGLMPRQAVSDVTTLKVMTHNIFGLNYNMRRVDAAIRAEDPDIVALQEFFPEQEGLAALLKERYPYFVQCRGGKRANLGLFSKLPFDKAMREDDCPPNARGEQRTAHITARFTLSTGTTFSLMTTHMDWPYPVERQHDQLAAAAEAINEIDGPLLVMGDFNSTPWSYALRGFETATRLRRETRNLVTFPELWTVPNGLIRLEPFLPLDHVFQRGMIVSELHAGQQTGSDHLPVVFTFSVAP